jgi:tetratricopeptide (TPR) repeat protein
MVGRMMKLRPVVTLTLLSLAIGLLAGCGSPEQKAQSAYDRGVKFLSQGDLVRASLEFRNAIKAKPDFVLALYSLGTVAEQQGRFDDAAKLYMDTAERAPNHIEARVRLGYILAADGYLDDAEKFAIEAGKLSASNGDVLALKAVVAYARNKPGEAISLADAALARDPNNLHALTLRGSERLQASDPKGALAFLNRAASIDDHDPGLQALRIRAFELLNDRASIEATLVKLAARYPKEESYPAALVRIYIDAGRKDDAERVFRASAAANPDDPGPELALAQFLANNKGLEAARLELQTKIDKGGRVAPFEEALADLWLAGGQRQKAVDTLKKAIADARDSSESNSAQVHLARIISDNDPAEAGKLVDRVIAADPNNADALVIRASLRINAGQVPDAIDDLHLALGQQPDSAAILELLADAYDRNGDVTLAQDQLVRGFTVLPESGTGLNYVGFLLRYGKLDQADRVLTELRSREPDNRVVLTELAQVKLGEQDWSGAREVSDALRKLGGREAASAADRIVAASLSAQGNFTESLRVLQSGVGANDAASLPAIVQAYIAAGKADQAERQLTSTLASRPGDLRAQLLLGKVYQAEKRPDEAEATFRAAISDDPKNAAAYGALAEFYKDGGRFADAEKILREGLSEANDIQPLKLGLAALLDASGQHEAAISQYEALYEADPRLPLVANNLASLLSEYRSDAASIDKAFAIAARFRDSGVPQFLDTLGWTYYLKGRYSDALIVLTSAAENLPGAATVQYHLGMVYKALGKRDLAMAKLKGAVSMVPPPDEEQQVKARAALADLLAAPPPQPKNPASH